MKIRVVQILPFESRSVCYSGNLMSVELSTKQLAPLAKGESKSITVHDSETDLNYVVIPESSYKKALPLLELMTDLSNHKPMGDSWSREANLRRIQLINQKHDGNLSPSEEIELNELQQRAYNHRKHVAPVENGVLPLVLEALEQRVRKA